MSLGTWWAEAVSEAEAELACDDDSGGDLNSLGEPQGSLLFYGIFLGMLYAATARIAFVAA